MCSAPALLCSCPNACTVGTVPEVGDVLHVCIRSEQGSSSPHSPNKLKENI